MERKLNTYRNDHTKESGQTKPIKINRKDDRKIKDTNKETTGADNGAHQNGQDNTCARRKWPNAEIAKEEDIMRKCADPRKESITSSAAEEDIWDYNRIQRINDNKQKKDFYNATLLVNNVPIKFIIDSGSPVTIIPECLFNDKTIKPPKTSYKDVNIQRIEFTRHTNALVKTNKETIELPLLITKAKNITTDGTGLDATVKNYPELK